MRKRQVKVLSSTFLWFCAASCGSAPLSSDEVAPLSLDAPSMQAFELGQQRDAAQAGGSVVHPLGHDDLCLDVVWGNNKDGTPVQVSKCNGNEAQMWRFSNGMLKVYGDKCLNVTDGRQDNGTRLQIWTCSGANSEDKNNLWQLRGTTLRWSKNTDRCLDVMGGNFRSGTPVQIWDCAGNGGNKNQRWSLSETAGAQPQPQANAPSAPPTGAAGTKSLVPAFQVGIHIDYDNAQGSSKGVPGFIARTQVRPELVANYVRIKKDGSFETGTAKHYADEAAAGGAKIISYAVTVEPTTLGDGHLQAIKETIAYARAKGLVVELRFGYEMNGYWSPPLYDKNSPSVYKKAWAQIAPVAHAAGAYMAWCPNVAGGAPSSYRAWLPDRLTDIDRVGIDYYLNAAQGQQPTAQQLESILSGIYPVVLEVNEAHKKANTGREVPFTFGETAVTLRDDRSQWGKDINHETQLKKQWLDALRDANIRQKYPLYRGFTWFDYYKTERSGGTTGETYHNAFELSQDPGSANMFRAYMQRN